MSNKLSREDAAELLRTLHEDQGLINPRFSRRFAFRLIEIMTGWFDEEQNYYRTAWLERWEEDIQEAPAQAVRLEPAKPPYEVDDDVPF